jgi:hypothetical protein
VPSPKRVSFVAVADRDRPRFLARQDGHRHPQQYVDNPAGALDLEAGEAVSEDYQREISDESRRRWEVMRAEELAQKATRSRKHKLEQLENEARKRNVDVTRPVATIDRALGEMHRLVWPT